MGALLVFQTDFTKKEGAVSAMYGVVKSVDASLEILESTHDIPRFDIWSASYRLYQPILFWPEGTIFVSVVDPGVGTSRRPCAAKTATGHFIITPDNGSLTHIQKHIGLLEVREIDTSRHRLVKNGNQDVAIFHGRDVFAYCAAKFASGQISFEEIGPAYPVDETIMLPIVDSQVKPLFAQGICEIDDPNFGNIWTNIHTKEALANGFAYGGLYRTQIDRLGEVIFDKALPLVHTFGETSAGDPLIYNDELNRFALAVNLGHFVNQYGIGYGNDYRVTFTQT
ncbi:MAG: SAM-dependent chlorinase/fluorinase [Oscillospiraceae bacterium]|jgi:S-adenosylmethionine hydrolase|nr:SAM-dependent chlorinase/fluorinase [Oscillospiraceae bacterium]